MSTLAQSIRLARSIPKEKMGDRDSDPLDRGCLERSIKRPADLIAIPYPTPRITPTAQDVIVVTANFYELDLIDLLSDRRDHESARARQVAYYMIKITTLLTFTEIGRAMGRDHTSILHGIRRTKNRLRSAERLRDEVELLKLKIAELFNARMRATKCVT